MTLPERYSKQKEWEGNSFIAKHIERSRWNRSVRQRFERQWLLNFAFSLGIQHGSWNSLFGGLRDWATQAGKARYTGNQITPKVLRRIAQLNSSPPGWQVLPKTPNIHQALAAKVGEDLLSHLYMDLDLSRVRNELNYWSTVCGSSFARIRFNPWAGTPKVFYLDPANQKPIPPAILTDQAKSLLIEMGSFQRVPEGEIEVTAHSPFEIFVPPVGHGENRAWMCQASLLQIDQVYDMFGEEVGQAVENSAMGARKALWLQNLSKLLGVIGPFGGWVIGPDDEDLVWVREFWYRACSRYPEGRYIVEANGLTVRDSTNPTLELGFNFPFVQFDYLRVPGRPFGKSLVEDLIWPQRTYNETHEMRQENMRLMGRPQWLNPKGSGARFFNKPGGIIEYNPNFPKPEVIKIPVIDQAVEIQANRSLQDMADIAAQQDVTQAKTPPNLRSGAAIQLLQEGDKSVLSPILQSMERSLMELGKKLLKFVAVFWEEGKMVRLWGKDQVLDIEPFRELALSDQFDVVIPAGSTLPKSKAVQAQFALEAAQMGLLDPSDPYTRKEILEVLELGTLDTITKEALQDVRRAELENEIFLYKGPQDGAWPAVESFDDHMIHLRVHDRARKSDVYELLPMEAKLAFDEHCKVHEEAIQAAMEAQNQLMMAAKGAPGQKGRPSPPRQAPQT